MCHRWQRTLLAPETRDKKSEIMKPAVHGLVSCLDCGAQLLLERKRLLYRTNARHPWIEVDMRVFLPEVEG